MRNRLKARWTDLARGLGFVPGAVVAAFAALGIVVVELDRRLDLSGVRLVFEGDGSAARTVLSVIAGSLITVAGLTFSITMVALQLTSSQFSPRVLRTFFADRITQVTIGTYVGTFVYSLLVLRSVGTFGDAGFVPRLSVTLATAFGIFAVLLLIVFLQHVAQMIQVSHVMGTIAHDTLGRLDRLYPERFGGPAAAGGYAAVLARWRAEPSGEVAPSRAGYVQRVALAALADRLAGEAERVAILVCPGDFAGAEAPVAEVWPPEAAAACRAAIRDAVSIRRERDLDQDVDFGLRQLTDTALKALSPGINDPATAVTCIGYVRSILARLTDRALPPPTRRFPEHGVTVTARTREYEEYLEVLLQLNRSARGDGWVTGELLRALEACATVASRSGATERADAIVSVAGTIAAQAACEARNERDRATAGRGLAAVAGAAAGARR